MKRHEFTKMTAMSTIAMHSFSQVSSAMIFENDNIVALNVPLGNGFTIF